MSFSPSTAPSPVARMILCSDSIGSVEAHLCDSTNTPKMNSSNSGALQLGALYKGQSSDLSHKTSTTSTSGDDDSDEEEKEQTLGQQRHQHQRQSVQVVLHDKPPAAFQNREPSPTTTEEKTYNYNQMAAKTATITAAQLHQSQAQDVIQSMDNANTIIKTTTSPPNINNDDDWNAVSVGLMASGLAWVKRQKGYRRRLEQRRYLDALDQAQRLMQATKELDEEDDRLLQLQQQQQGSIVGIACPPSPPLTTTTSTRNSLWYSLSASASPATPAKVIEDMPKTPNSAPLVPQLTQSIYSISSAIMMPAYATCASYDADDMFSTQPQESSSSSSNHSSTIVGDTASTEQLAEDNHNEDEDILDDNLGPSGTSFGFFCSDDPNTNNIKTMHDDDDARGGASTSLVQEAQNQGAVSVFAQVLATLSYEDADDAPAAGDDFCGGGEPRQPQQHDVPNHYADGDDNFMSTAYQVCRRPEASQVLLPDTYNDEDGEGNDVFSDDITAEYTVVHVEETLEEKNDVSWIPPVRLVPEMGATETILTPAQQHAIATVVLPKSIACCRWNRLYSLGRDGDSFDLCLYKIRQHSPSLLVVRTTREAIFGAFSGEEWLPTGEFHGNSETCLYSFPQTVKNAVCSPVRGSALVALPQTPQHPSLGSPAAQEETTPARCPTPTSFSGPIILPFTPPRQHRHHNETSLLDTDDESADEEDDEKCPPEIKIYRYTGVNRYIQVCDISRKLLALGGGGDGGSFGLCLEQDFQRGSTGPCDTFNNDPLCSQDNFNIVDVELWGFMTGQF